MPRTINPSLAQGAYVVAPVVAPPLTMACWFQAGDPGDVEPRSILSLWAASNQRHSLSQNKATGSSRLSASSQYDVTTAEVFAPGTFALGQWHHGAAVFESNSTRRAYLNAAGASATLATTQPNITHFGVGLGIQFAYFQGQIAHAALWSVALTDGEIRALALGYSPTLIRPAALLGYWPLDGTSTTIELDRWRGRRDLTLQNNPPPYTGRPHTFIRPTGGRVTPFLPVPEAPHSPTPADGAVHVLSPVTLAWAAPLASAMDLYLGITNPPPLFKAGLTAPTDITGPPMDGARYYWRIVSRNAVGETIGPIWSFTMLAPPPAPSGPTPADGAVSVPSTTALSWSPSPTATQYNVYLSVNGGPGELIAAGIPAPSVQPDLLPAARYVWQVVAANAAGQTIGPAWTFRTAAGAILVGRARIEAQLGPGFRSRLINEAFNVGTWPLAEQARLQARDISGRNHHGTWEGSGFTSGVPFNIPEGALGTTFNGNGFVNVPNMIESNEFNLSLAGGDIDLVVMVRGAPQVSEGRWRALICKAEAPWYASNGYVLAMHAGALLFMLNKGGASVFSLQTGERLVDGGEHLIAACYRTVTGDVQLSVDGVVVVAIKVTPGIEAPITTVPLRIGAMSVDNTPNDGGGFIGTLAYASIGREGDINLGPELQAQRQWTDLTPHVRAAVPLQTRTGIGGNGPQDTVATTGTLNFVLDNGYRAPVGYYTPGHPGARPGWGMGTPIRLGFDFLGRTYFEFVGRLMQVTPLAGSRNARSVDCLATDWMDVAAGTPLSALSAQLNRASDFVMRAVLDQAQGRSPAAVRIGGGAGIWPFAIDEGESERDTLMTEIARVVTSERGFAYIRGDTDRGGLFVFEGHAERVALPIAATFNNTMQGLEVGYGLDQLLNIIKVTYHPRRVDGAVVTLYALDISQHAEALAAGETRVFEGGYVDPTEQAERVGGTQIEPLVVGTHIRLWSNADGSGGNLDPALRIVQTLGGNSYRLEVTNTGATPGYLRLTATAAFEIKGKGIYHYKPITIERRDSNSVRERGPRLFEVDLPYESDGAVATTIAEFYLEVYGVEQPIPSSLTITGNTSVSMMRSALGLQPGDKIAIGEPMTGLAPDVARFIVHEKRLTYIEPGLVSVAFILAPAPVSLTIRRQLGSQGAT